MKEVLGVKDEDEKQKQREKTTYVALLPVACSYQLTTAVIYWKEKSRAFH